MPGDILPSKQGVIVLSGYGVSIAVERGHLVLSDGIGDERRNGRFSRVHKIKRLIVVGHSGFISFDAVRWLKDTSIHFVQMDYDSNVMLCDAWTIGERVALRRAQALAPFTETGNAVTRYLLEQKVHGQANVIALYDRQTSADIRQLHERIAHTERLDEMQFIEAEGAILYWAALAPRTFPFTQRDEKAVPLHWHTIGARVSPLTNSPRKAITPFHAMLNYLYALLEGETSIALRVIGFDPSLGILHTDQEYRRSFAHDVMEAARPAVDSWLLTTIAARPFIAKEFSETRDGECRLTVAIRRLLSDTVLLWRNAVAPIVEHIAVLLAGNALPSSLTGEKRSAGRPQNNGTAKPKRQEPITIARSCKRCGEIVPKERRVFCSDVCRIAFQGEQLTSTINTLNSLQIAPQSAPEVPPIDVSPLPADYTLEQYHQEIAPALARVPVAFIRRATGLSYAYCKRIRRGNVVPHVAHWAALRAMIAD